MVTRNRSRNAVAVTFALVLSVALASPSFAAGGHVLPARARVHGVTLTEAARRIAYFTSSGNDPAFYPANLPFQVLYVGDEQTVTPEDGGFLVTGGNTFTVPVGTFLYVPLFNVNDVPPVLGEFPTSRADAISYFFDPDQVGGAGFEIVVDGKVTPLGPEYLVGPINTPLPGGGSIITLGVFLSPLSPGTHTVEIRGGAFGDLVEETYGITHLREDFVYTVNVVRGRR